MSFYGWYPALLKREGDRVLVEFPDFPEAHTYGNDRAEALERARDALATIVDAYIRDREPLPQASIIDGAHAVRLPALTEIKVDLYNAMRKSKVTKTQLARRLGWHLPQVDRLLDVQHASRLDQLETAFGALGKELHVYVTPADRGHRSGARGRSSGGSGLPQVGRARASRTRRPRKAR